MGFQGKTSILVVILLIVLVYILVISMVLPHYSIKGVLKEINRNKTSFPWLPPKASKTFDVNQKMEMGHQTDEAIPKPRTKLRLLQLPGNEFMKEQEIIQAERKHHLHTMCEKYHKNTSDLIKVVKSTQEILVVEKHKMIMCVTAKVAGKSWKRVLNVLAGLSNSSLEGESWRAVHKARQIRRITKDTPEEIQRKLLEYTVIMFSRHPLSRVLSAFNNKLSPNATDYRNRKAFWSVGYNIIKRYRPGAASLRNRNPATYDLTFPEFVRFLIDQKQKTRTNNHWIENYKFCHPCDIPYTVIGRFETLLEDARYILKLTKVDDIVSFPEKEGFAGNSTHSSELNKLRSFYQQVPVKDLQKLVQKYKMDYVLFNYTLPTEDDLRQWLGITGTDKPSGV